MSILLPQTGGGPTILRLICRFPILAPIAALVGALSYATQSWWPAVVTGCLGAMLVIAGILYKRYYVK